MMAVAAAAAQPAPGMFSFLKHGVVISARRYGLFLRVFALNVALSTALLTFEFVVVPREESRGYIAGIEDDDDTEFSSSRVVPLPGRVPRPVPGRQGGEEDRHGVRRSRGVLRRAPHVRLLPPQSEGQHPGRLRDHRVWPCPPGGLRHRRRRRHPRAAGA